MSYLIPIALIIFVSAFLFVRSKGRYYKKIFRPLTELLNQ